MQDQPELRQGLTDHSLSTPEGSLKFRLVRNQVTGLHLEWPWFLPVRTETERPARAGHREEGSSLLVSRQRAAAVGRAILGASEIRAITQTLPSTHCSYSVFGLLPAELDFQHGILKWSLIGGREL